MTSLSAVMISNTDILDFFYPGILIDFFHLVNVGQPIPQQTQPQPVPVRAHN